MDIDARRLTAAELSGGTSSSDIYAAAIAAAKNANPAPSEILDFGSGNGHFLNPIRAAFPKAHLSAADIMQRPSGIAEEVAWYASDLNAALASAAASFDLVFAIEVIEHLENPRHVLREIHRVLVPGGHAILTTPNTGSYRSLLTLFVRGHHAQFDNSNYPAHITPMSEIDFRRAGDEAGLAIEKFFYTDVGTVPKFLRYRWQRLPLIGRILKGKRYSDNFGVVFRKP